MKANPFVSVVTSVHNEEHCIGTLLTLLMQQTYAHDLFEVIVVDDHSTDRTVEIIKQYPVRLICQSQKSNQWICMNTAILQAKGDVIATTDADCQPTARWLTAGISSMKNQHADLIGGGISFLFPHGKSASALYDSLTFLHQQDLIERRGVAVTANLFFKKTVWEHMGGFPPQKGWSGDIAFTDKAVSSGGKIFFEKDAFIHHPARTTRQLFRKSFNIGLGKGNIIRTMGIQNLHKIFGNAVPIAMCNLNPIRLMQRMRKQNILITIPLFLQILLVSYLCFFCAITGTSWALIRTTKKIM